MRSLAKAGAAYFGMRVVRYAASKVRKKSRRAELYRAYADAARDPEFMAEMAETDRAFDVTSADGLVGPRV